MRQSRDAFSLEWLAPRSGGSRDRRPLDGGWLLFRSRRRVSIGLRRDPIYGGDVDLTDDAVLALIRVGRDLVGSCSGTTIATAGGSGFLLTAAHCAGRRRRSGRRHPPRPQRRPFGLLRPPGPDYAATHANVFRVAEVKVHPQYDGTVENPYDVAVIRYVGTTSTTPVIPILAPEDDLLVVGSEVSLVGFGTTESSTRNSQRRMVTKPVADLCRVNFAMTSPIIRGAAKGTRAAPHCSRRRRGSASPG